MRQERPLEVAVESAIGHLATRKDLASRVAKSESGKKFMRVLNGLFLLVRIADASVDLYGHLQLPSAGETSISEPSEPPKLIDPPGTTEPPIVDGEVLKA